MKFFAIIIFTIIFLFSGQIVFCQTDSSSQKYITVHFLYGSKPARGYKKSEPKYFGGIHGGHVSIQIDTMNFSFHPQSGWHIIGHIFARRHKIKGGYSLEPEKEWEKDTVGKKYTSMRIPISDSQYVELQNVEKNLLEKSPYDYAFIGMRCASAAADVLSQIGILKKRSVVGDICRDFYPKRLRKKLFRYAKQHNVIIIRKQGRKSGSGRKIEMIADV